MNPYHKLPPKEKRLQTEWLFVNAFRELKSFMNPGDSVPTYREIIEEVKSYFPRLFDNKDSILGNRIHENELIKKFRQEAAAESQMEGIPKSPLTLVKERLKKLDGFIKNSKRADITELKKEQKKLKEAELFFEWEEKRHGEAQKADDEALENDPEDIYGEKLKRFSEDEILHHDYDHYLERNDHNLLANNWGKSRDLKTSDGTVLRLRLLHPNKPEHTLGTDIIYELHHPTENKIRFVHIQYKLWERGILYFSQHTNLEAQLNKMHKSVCDGKFCTSENGETSCSDYRLPFCSAFLRPTDKLQDVNSPMISSGWHLPVCKVSQISSISWDGNKMLKVNNVKRSALSHLAFEEIFNANMLGSRWLTYEEVEQLYREHNILDESERIVIYAQHFKRHR
jgi:hypothetical protein